MQIIALLLIAIGIFMMVVLRVPLTVHDVPPEVIRAAAELGETRAVGLMAVGLLVLVFIAYHRKRKRRRTPRPSAYSNMPDPKERL